MKRRSREISIFSMSALDLFASALGAFILIAIVMFPYFPNTASGCPVATVCPAPVPAPVCPACPPTPDPSPPATQFPHLDLVIALDITGSMRDQVAGLRAEVDQLASVMTGLTPSFAMGVVAFGDRAFDRPVSEFGLREISSSSANRALLRDFITDSVKVNVGIGGGGNPDPPEAFLSALTIAVGMNWRSNAEMRIVVVITDNPAYPEEVARSEEVAEAFANDGGRVSTVSIGTAAASFLENVANAGGGQFVRDAGGSLTATLLLSLM